MTTDAAWRPVVEKTFEDGHPPTVKPRGVRTHVLVLEQIEERILDGRLKPGDRLPGERDLAGLLQVSRGSVREALRVLESMGIASSGAGRGPDSGCIVTGTPTQALSNLLRLHLALAHFGLEDLVETRIQLEGHAAERAALRASEEDLANLASLVEAMAEPNLAAAEFNALDTEFHVAIAEASQNRLLSVLMQGLRDAVQREMILVSEGLPDWGPVARKLRQEHLEILKHIREGDGTGAAKLLDSHIRTFYSEVVSVRQPSRINLPQKHLSEDPSDLA